jgi:uncharacterized protein YdbL (DUF1318 family)
MSVLRGVILAVGTLLAVSPALAQGSPALSVAIASGQVGERYDGYMGVVTSASSQVRRQVSAVNLQRRSLYFQLATTRHVNAQVVGIATGCQLIAHLSAGQAYMLGDGSWRRVIAGQARSSPDYCR